MSTEPSELPCRKRIWVGVLIAIVVPTVVTLSYFVAADTYPPAVQQAVYLVVKVANFLLPVAWVWCVLREPVRIGKFRSDGMLIGLAFGLVILVVTWLLYRYLLVDMEFFAKPFEKIREKIMGFGIDSHWKFALFGLFYSLIHSLLEEYYWRWFVFGQLRRVVPIGWAIVVSALGFTAHHVIVLGTFFDWNWLATVLLSLAVTVGGVVWAWLYNRAGTLYAPWASHALVDAGIFLVGYHLVRHLL